MSLVSEAAMIAEGFVLSLLKKVSCVHLVAGFPRSALISVTFPQSLVIFASEAFSDAQELLLITFEDGPLILRMNQVRGTNLPSLCFQDSVNEPPGFVKCFTGHPRVCMDYSSRCLAMMRRKAH